MIALFRRKQSPKTIARNDGYSAYNAQLVCALQESIERTAAPDYDALRATLSYARSINDYRLTPSGIRGYYEDRAFGYLYR